MLLALALLGSGVMVTGTLGRIAEAKDAKQAGFMAQNRQFALLNDELQVAKTEAGRECKSGFGAKCSNAKARIDSLTAEMSSHRVVAIDAKADAIASFAALFGFDVEHTKAIVSALDPVALPLFLELGSVLMFGAAFHGNARQPKATVIDAQQMATSEPATFARVWSKQEALADLKRLREAGSGRWLAARWGVHPGTVSKWLSEFEDAGHVERARDGKAKALVVVGGRR
jgi:hypothetical protein